MTIENLPEAFCLAVSVSESPEVQRGNWIKSIRTLLQMDGADDVTTLSAAHEQLTKMKDLISRNEQLRRDLDDLRAKNLSAAATSGGNSELVREMVSLVGQVE